MSNEKKPAEKLGWQTPTFEKLDRLGELMKKALDMQIQIGKEQMQDMHNLLEVKKKLEEKLGKKKK
jgi:hypothetical protein